MSDKHHLVFFGCSFTAGDDSIAPARDPNIPVQYPDDNQAFEFKSDEYSYPGFVRKLYSDEFTVDNRGRSASSMEAVLIELKRWIETAKHNQVLLRKTIVVVNETSMYRCAVGRLDSPNSFENENYWKDFSYSNFLFSAKLKHYKFNDIALAAADYYPIEDFGMADVRHASTVVMCKHLLDKHNIKNVFVNLYGHDQHTSKLAAEVRNDFFVNDTSYFVTIKEQYGDQAFSQYSNHFCAFGYQKVAELVYPYIKEKAND